MKYYFDSKELKNIFYSENEIFNIPFSIESFFSEDNKKNLSTINIDVEEAVKRRGFEIGTYNVVFNFFRNQLNSSFANNFFIKEIKKNFKNKIFILSEKLEIDEKRLENIRLKSLNGSEII